MPVNPNLSNHVNKNSINLLQPELFPKQASLTLSRVVTVWCLVLVVMVAWALMTHYHQASLKTKLSVLQQENSQQKKQLATLTAQLTARKVDTLLVDRLATIKLLMANKQALHAKLTDPNLPHVAGFATAMDELAQLHHQDIRLETININNDNMTFTGLALTPEAVPAWLAGFEHSTLLSGKSFFHFKLSENEQQMTEFMVSSNMKEVPTHE